MRDEALGDITALARRLDNNGGSLPASMPVTAASGLQRVADVPIYATDMLVRRAASLQLSADARPPVAGLPGSLWRQLGLQAGDKVLVAQGENAVVLDARMDATLAEHTVRVAAGHPATAALGGMFGAITVEKLLADAAGRA